MVFLSFCFFWNKPPTRTLGQRSNLIRPSAFRVEFVPCRFEHKRHDGPLARQAVALDLFGACEASEGAAAEQRPADVKMRHAQLESPL